MVVVEEAALSVLDLLSDDAAVFESALAPSELLAAVVDSFDPDSEAVAFLRASEG
ncbi:MAG TPA: hypothetical protein VFE48_09030 [Methylomirabilota bacterium]|nr:hypothetical protein [Methylomirabilota bacterium]